MNIKYILIYFVTALIGSGTAFALGNPKAKFPVDLRDESLEDIVMIYRIMTGWAVVSEVESSFKVNLKSAKEVNQAEYFQLLEDYFRVNGIVVVREDNRTVRLVRVSEGEFFSDDDDSTNTRLQKTLDALKSKNATVARMTFDDVSPLGVLDLVQSLTGKTVLRGPGLPLGAKINYDSAEALSINDAVLALDSLLQENGIILVDSGDDTISALTVKE